MTVVRRTASVVLALSCVGAGLAIAAAPSVSAGPQTVGATADTYVHELVRTTNNGTSASLASYGTPTVTSLLRFRVPTVPDGEQVVSATLRLRSTALASAGSVDAQQVRLTTGTWSEGSTVWANRPGLGAVVGTLPAPSAPSATYEVALDASTVRAASGSDLSLAVAGTGTDSFWFGSRESSTAASRPSLVVVTEPTAPGDTTPPSQPTNLTATVDESTVALSWTASTDATGVTAYEVHRSATAGFTPDASTLVATRSVTTWTDTRPPGTWHYAVVARDAAGNRSVPSTQVSATVQPPPTGPPVAVVASADTYVHDLVRTTNYGTSPSLAAYGTPNVVSYLRFAVPAAANGQAVVSASLRLRTTSLASAGSANAQQVRLAADGWSEASTLYANRPALGAAVGTLAGPTVANQTYQVTLDPSAVNAAAGGSLSLAVTGTGSDSFWFASREATAANRPTLVVQLGGTTPPGDATVVTAVGDIACASGTPVTATTCRHAEVAETLAAVEPDRFVALGDLQYQNATLSQFLGAGAYDDTFGRLKPITLPVVGNHELTDPSGPARGYFDYFYGAGNATGPFGARPDGYYSTTIGSWTFIGLNTECEPESSNGNNTVSGGCAPGSPQYQWLQAQLAASAPCTIVAAHRPRWTTGTSHAPYAAMAPMWDLMASAGVDVVLGGHVHSTEVFKPIGVSGTGNPVLDPNGIRSFVLGSGGANLRSFGSPSGVLFTALEARDNTTMGGVKLTLRATGYDWAMVPIPGQAFTNSGTTGSFSGTSSCH